MQAYLFVHFREKTTPDGEQVYFSLSKDGFYWEEVNNGCPVLWAYYGDKGARDFTIIRCLEQKKFYILGTDLSLSYGLRNQYHNSWEEIGKHGSKQFVLWESADLVNWSEQRLIQIPEAERFGCLWAPDVIYDKDQKDYLLHWSSSHEEDQYKRKRIYCCRTVDFLHFTKPVVLYEKEDSNVIDSAICYEDGTYYMFVKSEGNPENIIMLFSKRAEGPYKRIADFDRCMEKLEKGTYEAPAIVRLKDRRWCLFLDYYGVPGAGQGYVPFLAEDLKSGNFLQNTLKFHFPYGFKHGTVLAITEAEYNSIKTHDWSDKGYIS